MTIVLTFLSKCWTCPRRCNVSGIRIGSAVGRHSSFLGWMDGANGKHWRMAGQVRVNEVRLFDEVGRSQCACSACVDGTVALSGSECHSGTRATAGSSFEVHGLSSHQDVKAASAAAPCSENHG